MAQKLSSLQDTCRYKSETHPSWTNFAKHVGALCLATIAFVLTTAIMTPLTALAAAETGPFALIIGPAAGLYFGGAAAEKVYNGLALPNIFKPKVYGEAEGVASSGMSFFQSASERAVENEDSGKDLQPLLECEPSTK